MRTYRLLATDEGRRLFWAESSRQVGDRIVLCFSDGTTCSARLVAAEPPARFEIEYFGGNLVTFELEAAEGGGTELTLTERGAALTELEANRSGWVSVLLALKAAATSVSTSATTTRLAPGSRAMSTTEDFA